MQSEAHWHASVFGAFALVAPDGTEITIKNRRARAILAMLCLAPGEAVERSHISKLLWPGRFDAQARASLRQCLLDLGKVLAPWGADVLDISHAKVAVKASAVQTELTQLEGALAEGRYSCACDLLVAAGAQPLLDQLDLGDPFREWLIIRRQHIERRLERIVDRALKTLNDLGNTEDLARLRDAWKARVGEAGFRRIDARIRIAVLPFHSVAAGDAPDVLALGLVEALISVLGELPQVIVAGRTSSFQFENSALPVAEIARALHVTHLIEGSVIRQGEVAQINVRLIDGETGFETCLFRRKELVADIFTVQDAVAGGAAVALGRVLGRALDGPSGRATTKSKAAYELYLQGRALTFRAIGEGVLPKAIELLRQALELDPDFAKCWTALAEAHVYTAVYTPCLERMAQSELMAQCARKAIALDPSQGHARAMLGIHEWTRHNPVGALDLAYEAYRLEPYNADVSIRLGSFLLYIGRSREALPYIEAAVEQDPVHGRNYAMLSSAHLNLGNAAKAIAAGQRMTDLGMPGMWLALATAATGDHELAVEQYRQCRLLMNKVMFPPPGVAPMSEDAMDYFWTIAARGCCSGKPEDRALYCQILDDLHAGMPDPHDPSIAFPAIWMGHADLVMKIYKERIHPANMFGLMSLWSEAEPMCRTRKHPQFMEFAESIGLVAAWEKYGWPDLLPDPRDSREGARTGRTPS